MSRTQEISIGLLWHSAGSGNLGVGALTVGNLISARLAAEAVGLQPRFTILHFPSDLRHSYLADEGVRIFEIDRRTMLSPGGFWAEVGKLDCVLDIGAGDSFADIYGFKRFAFLWASKEMALLRRTPLLLSPQTIGPFTRQPQKAMAAHAMNGAYAVMARDPESMRAIAAMAPQARAIQSVDVAFRLPFERPSRTPGGPLEIGVNVSGLLFNGGYGGANEYGLDVDYADLMRRFIARQVARSNTRVHLICHVVSELIAADDDARVADRLAEEFPEAVRVPNFTSPSDAKSYIAGLDFLVAGRMHACIAAYSTGVPVVPIAYSRKFSGLFGGALGYRHQVPVKGLGTDEALAFIEFSLEQRETLASAIAEGQVVVEPALKAYDAVLQELFTDVCQRRPG